MFLLRKENRQQEGLTGGWLGGLGSDKESLLPTLVRHLRALVLTRPRPCLPRPSPVFGLPGLFLARILLSPFRKNPPPLISDHPALPSARILLSQFSMNHRPPTLIPLLSNFPSLTSSLCSLMTHSHRPCCPKS